MIWNGGPAREEAGGGRGDCRGQLGWLLKKGPTPAKKHPTEPELVNPEYPIVPAEHPSENLTRVLPRKEGQPDERDAKLSATVARRRPARCKIKADLRG
jgi:hypothetical protein